MIFLLDENFPKSAENLLTAWGHDVIDVRGTELQGADDFQLFEFAQQNQAVLLTTDRDFYHTVPFIFGEHHGVIVIAIRQPNRAAILARLKWVLEQDFLKEIKSKIVLLKDRTYRIRSIE